MLWHRGLLGDPSSQVLLDTMVYYCGLYFALRTGKEHRQLRNSPCQIEVVERSGEKAYLWYTEDVSKNHQGGLNGRKVKPKVVLHHANPLTVALCDSFGSTGNTVHQMLRQVPSTSETHSDLLVLVTTSGPHHSGEDDWMKLQECWYRTNHSLRLTSVTRLYQSGVDEQLVMERTGHRSLDRVRSYKRTSDSQREALSDILNR